MYWVAKAGKCDLSSVSVGDGAHLYSWLEKRKVAWAVDGLQLCQGSRRQVSVVLTQSSLPPVTLALMVTNAGGPRHLPVC